MRSKVTDASLNEKLINRISRLSNLYESAIHPDNVSFIPSSLVNKAGHLLSEMKASTDAGVNGVEFDDVAAYVNYLGSTGIEFKAIAVNELVADATDGTSAVRDKKETNIAIPEGFDGRSGFVFAKLFGLVDGVEDVPGQWTGQAIETAHIPFTMEYDQWLRISQTKKKVTFNTFLLRNFMHYGHQYDRLYLRGFILLWRNK